MTKLGREIKISAERVVGMAKSRGLAGLDYSERSLETVEEMLAEASAYFDEMTGDQRECLAQDFGCYILEVARQTYGGRYTWWEEHQEPVLVHGEPEFHLAIAAWDKVRRRLSGDLSNNIPFFFQGFSERAKNGKAGMHTVIV
jgi:hypothetical protein